MAELKPDSEAGKDEFHVSWKIWLAGARPKTLAAGISPVLAGAWLAHAHGFPLSWLLLLATLFSCLCLQAATNYINDALDGRRGTDTHARLGPMRLTATGVTTWQQTLVMGITTLVLASIWALPLISARGWPICAIGVPSLFFAYAYTGGPKPLAYHGLGEVFVLIFFGFVATLGSAFVQSGAWLPSAWIAGAQIGFASTLLIVVNNIRDMEEDRRAHKMTLAGRFGLNFGRSEVVFLAAAIPLTGLFWLLTPWKVAAWAGVVSLWRTVPIVRAILRDPPSPKYNQYLARCAAHLVLFCAALCALWIV